MRDPMIREALHRTVLRKYHEDENTIVLDEFGLDHGAIRADIAVLNGILHGYEIKSAGDTLNRLPAQVAAYSAVFDKVTLVLAEKHLKPALKMVPTWWGVSVVRAGKRNGIHFTTVRKALPNNQVQPDKLAKLLWRSEAVDFLKGYDVPPALLNKPKRFLYERINELSDIGCLHNFVLNTLKTRTNWREHLSPL